VIGMTRGFRFHDRRDAGRILAGRLQGMELDDPVVVALPRGGVPVAYEVAQALGAPLDIALVRKLGAPGQPELGIGALGEDGTVILDSETVQAMAVTRSQIEAIVEREAAELERRRRLYRGDVAAIDVAGRTVVLVDDGLATGVTAVAAAQVLRARGAARLIVAVPVCPAGTERRLGDRLGEIVCLEQPLRFGGVGAWYEDFTQTPDREVIALLRASRVAKRDLGERDAATAGRPPLPHDGVTTIRTGEGAALDADFRAPRPPQGIVVLVHGSGSSRLSPRNVAVARHLERRGFATLLFDLLTAAEARDRGNVFDIDLLSRRLVDVTRWVRRQPGLGQLPLAYFGASTGAAAALRAAAALGPVVAAVVSRGGRPDLAGDALAQVAAPTLLIVGGDDWNVLELNDEAATLLAGPHELAVVPGAGHLFEEPGALEQVARLAGDWLELHLGSADGGLDAQQPSARSGGPHDHPGASDRDAGEDRRHDRQPERRRAVEQTAVEPAARDHQRGHVEAVEDHVEGRQPARHDTPAHARAGQRPGVSAMPPAPAVASSRVAATPAIVMS
jgi:putative phosphoribosyl transferase